MFDVWLGAHARPRCHIWRLERACVRALRAFAYVIVTFLFVCLLLFTVEDDLCLSLVWNRTLELVTKTLTKIRSSRTFFCFLCLPLLLFFVWVLLVCERPFSIFVCLFWFWQVTNLSLPRAAVFFGFVKVRTLVSVFCFCLLVKCVYLECCYTIALLLFWYLLNTRAFVLEDRDITMCLCVLVWWCECSYLLRVCMCVCSSLSF